MGAFDDFFTPEEPKPAAKPSISSGEAHEMAVIRGRVIHRLQDDDDYRDSLVDSLGHLPTARKALLMGMLHDILLIVGTDPYKQDSDEMRASMIVMLGYLQDYEQKGNVK